MMNWFNDTTAAQLRMRELHAMAERERLARRARGRTPRRLRRYVGQLLIATGEALACPPLDLEPQPLPAASGRQC